MKWVVLSIMLVLWVLFLCYSPTFIVNVVIYFLAGWQMGVWMYQLSVKYFDD